MGRLTGEAIVKKRLGEAVRGRKRWVFISVAGGNRKHKSLGWLILHLTFRWLPLGINPEALCDFGDFDFANLFQNLRASVAFVTVPKSALGLEDLNELLGKFDPPQRTDGEQDLFLFCGDIPEATRTVESLVDAIHDDDWLPMDTQRN
jgi:hypothetical protein